MIGHFLELSLALFTPQKLGNLFNLCLLPSESQAFVVGLLEHEGETVVSLVGLFEKSLLLLSLHVGGAYL
jgi:hypothetical protein